MEPIDPDDSVDSVVIIPTTDFDYKNFACPMNYSLIERDMVYIINSEEDFSLFFTCEDSAPIDFALKTLLIARGNAGYSIYSTTAELSRENNTYLLSVEVVVSFYTVALPWEVCLLVDKINVNSVQLNVNEYRIAYLTKNYYLCIVKTNT